MLRSDYFEVTSQGFLPLPCEKSIKNILKISALIKNIVQSQCLNNKKCIMHEGERIHSRKSYVNILNAGVSTGNQYINRKRTGE